MIKIHYRNYSSFFICALILIKIWLYDIFAEELNHQPYSSVWIALISSARCRRYNLTNKYLNLWIIIYPLAENKHVFLYLKCIYHLLNKDFKKRAAPRKHLGVKPRWTYWKKMSFVIWHRGWILYSWHMHSIFDWGTFSLYNVFEHEWWRLL